MSRIRIMTLALTSFSLVAMTLMASSPSAYAQASEADKRAADDEEFKRRTALNMVPPPLPCPGQASSGGCRNGLPPTNMDSFVYEAKEHAENIYGDEGCCGPPPFCSFSECHRINTGILCTRNKGLTTGHASYLPDAWGKDEFLCPPGEWSKSGCNNGSACTDSPEILPEYWTDQLGFNWQPLPGTVPSYGK